MASKLRFMWIGSFPYRFGKWGRRSWKKCIFHGPFQAIPKPFKLIRKSSTMTLFWEVHYERFYSLNSLLERKGDSRWSRKHWNKGKTSWVWHPHFLISYTPRITKMHIWKYSFDKCALIKKYGGQTQVFVSVFQCFLDHRESIWQQGQKSMAIIIACKSTFFLWSKC